MAALQTELATTVQALTTEGDAMIAELQAALDEKDATSESELRTTKEDANKYMIQQVNIIKEEMAIMKEEYEKSGTKKDTTIKQIDSMSRHIREKMENAERALEDAEDVS